MKQKLFIVASVFALMLTTTAMPAHAGFWSDLYNHFWGRSTAPVQPTINKKSAPTPTPTPTPSPALLQTTSKTKKPQGSTQSAPKPTPTPSPSPTPAGSTSYPLHSNITATVFWVGEPVGGGSSEDNALSAWDDLWQAHFGCFDDPYNRTGFFPKGCTPKENPFYNSLPYNDYDDNGNRRANAYDVVPWAKSQDWTNKSMMKNQWVRIIKGDKTCYSQVEDSGPYIYDDYAYVFSNKPPKNTRANNAGLDVSPAVRDCLGFNGLNNDENKVNWQFVTLAQVPDGPWKKTITTSQLNWK